MSGRPFALANVLAQTLENIDTAFLERNSKVNDWKSVPRKTEIMAAEYFGLPLNDSKLDMTHTHLIDIMYDSVESAQFFSKLLSEDLERHARSLRDELAIRGLKIHQIDFSSIKKDLLPREEFFKQWIENFN